MRSNRARFVEETCKLLGAAAVATVVGGGIAVAESDTPSVPVQGPIPFEVLDLDESGGISEQEFEQVHTRRTEAREQAGLPALGRRRPFGDFDADRDGQISRQEFQAAQGATGAGAGMRTGTGRGRGEEPPAFSEFDLNGDGVIAEQEFIDARTKRIAPRVREGRMMRGLITAPTFSDLDADGNGSLSPEEFATGMQRHWEGMGGAGPHGAGP